MTHAVAIATASQLSRRGKSTFRTMQRSPLRSMAAGRGQRSIRHMHRLPLVYTAAFAASGDRAVAEQVAERVMMAARGGDETSLAERAVLLALRSSPHRAFAPMRSEDREVVALARLTGATTGRVATVLGISPEEVRSRMTSGLRALLSAGGGPRTPPPRRGSGSAASRGRA
jgi:DNA-directed RNA polymerase specialized sigma24 family protein